MGRRADPSPPGRPTPLLDCVDDRQVLTRHRLRRGRRHRLPHPRRDRRGRPVRLRRRTGRSHRTLLQARSRLLRPLSTNSPSITGSTTPRRWSSPSTRTPCPATSPIRGGPSSRERSATTTYSSRSAPSTRGTPTRRAAGRRVAPVTTGAGFQIPSQPAGLRTQRSPVLPDLRGDYRRRGARAVSHRPDRTGHGAPGGHGIKLRYSDPMLLDDVAADFPGPDRRHGPPGGAVGRRPDRDRLAQGQRLRRPVWLVTEYFPPQLVTDQSPAADQGAVRHRSSLHSAGPLAAGFRDPRHRSRGIAAGPQGEPP